MRMKLRPHTAHCINNNFEFKRTESETMASAIVLINNTFKFKRTQQYKRTRCWSRANTTPVLVIHLTDEDER